MRTLIVGASIIDGISDQIVAGHSIWIEGKRIKAIGARAELGVPADTQIVDAAGKFVIPGLMNANVHLLCDVRLENLVRHMECYEDLIAEAAQVALKNGVTTVFDTWGPRRFLIAVRDRIERGEIAGSRIFCAGNIIGFDGPFSHDFIAKTTEIASAALVEQINAIWAENVGRELMWLTPAGAAKEVRAYIARGIDFVKFASNEHFGTSAGAFLAFSPDVQAAIVAEAHDAGLTAQAHTTSLEGLRIAIEAGCDLIQHANHTGPVAMTDSILKLFVTRKTGAVVFPFTQRALDWLAVHESGRGSTMRRGADHNVRALIGAGARILLANDGAIFAPEAFSDPLFSKSWAGLPEEDGLIPLGTGHFTWLKAMEEKGMAPMDMLRAATRNVAVAYGKDGGLGALGPGKLADMLILDKNPLLAAENYRSIETIIKEGAVVDRHALPNKAILTRSRERSSPVQLHSALAGPGFPTCPACSCH
jgi:imidazolonepropionase-like amidohydrolase